MDQAALGIFGAVARYECCNQKPCCDNCVPKQDHRHVAPPNTGQIKTLNNSCLTHKQVWQAPILCPKPSGMTDTILSRCEARGLRLTDQRRIIAGVLEDADDHPDVEELYTRASAKDPRISLATVYRTVKLFEEAGILEKHDFGDGRARYETAGGDHHDHLIDLQSGEVIEFIDAEIEALQLRIADKLGYDLKGHRLELYGVKKDTKNG